MTIYLSSCSECGAEISRSKPSTTCSTRCRSRRSDRRRAERHAATADALIAGLRGNPTALALGLAGAVETLRAA